MSAFDQVRAILRSCASWNMFAYTRPLLLLPHLLRVQYLDEDPRTNRIDDSLQLFTAICQNKLLSKAALILMLNKASPLIPARSCRLGADIYCYIQADLLKKKLEAGIKVRK